ncbi:hypothetical protein [Actinoplanes derwentensis]|uniref:Uncharacterized protein n=1 Tax=Actinoplanes derwentensis TaxID=113562 RepID=A0A1H2D939_9ACTN|nr:hypothetical protein [Actinoplanes derwentensis]GID86398.1 hypothetical protein Ade03nite_53220 [Actinoplanes derwentensis]SDT79109.1 hypothetical protein SAMN04489716_8648 [Actinoplanes derwentensis]
MTYDGQPDPGSGLYVSSAALAPQRSARRRKQAIVAVAGAAALLAGAGFLVTQLMNEQQPGLPEPAALAPMTPPVTTEPTTAAPMASPTRTPKTTRQAVPVQISPMPPPPPASLEPGYPDPGDGLSTGGVAAAEPLYPEPDLDDQPIGERTEALGSGTIRILSARRDLTSERQTLLSRDVGHAVGRGIRCTTEIRFGTGIPAGDPGILVCWRTSASRSVITIGQNTDTASSISVLSREWQAME